MNRSLIESGSPYPDRRVGTLRQRCIAHAMTRGGRLVQSGRGRGPGAAHDSAREERDSPRNRLVAAVTDQLGIGSVS